MDISSHISELLFDFDCVVIPGFGGFICNYQPSEIHPVDYTITPPAKSISFNRQLKANDGLLVNHIAQQLKVTTPEAAVLIENWVKASHLMLGQNEQVLVKNVGRLFNDVEGNLQFFADNSVNYLKASYGLRTITAPPVVKHKVIAFTEKFQHEVKPQNRLVKRNWRMAASFFLLGCLATVLILMQSDNRITALQLNDADVLSFINKVMPVEKQKFEPLPIPEVTANAPILPVETTQVPVLEDSDEVNANVVRDMDANYYIIIGAFKKQGNVNAAKALLEATHPGVEVVVETSGILTRVGYYAGNNQLTADEKLQAARVENPSSWLLKK